MTSIPDLWWSPTHGLIKREDGLCWLLTNGPLLEDGDAPLPADAIRLDEYRGPDYIRVGETIATENHQDTYRLTMSPKRLMYLEPVDTGEPHVIEVDEQGWTIKHPLPCRAQLFDCLVHKAALDTELVGTPVGRFACRADGDGYLVIGKEVS
jgi:hypothetical protein